MTKNFSLENNFLELEFSDKRLKKRFFKIMDAFFNEPGSSILSACGSREQAKAAYRFFANDTCSYEELRSSISKSTIEKMLHLPKEKILLIQDTTTISFGNRKGIDGMGYYCESEQKGMLVHSCIAVTQAGIPLGLVFQESFTRKEQKNKTESKEQRKFRPIEEKESFRWLSTLRECHIRIPNEVSKLTICDREGDFYELFSDAEEQGEQFLIRLTQNRPTQEGKKLFEQLKSSPVRGSLVLQIGRNPKEHLPTRKVKMDYHYETITIKKPQRRKEEHLKNSLTLTGIYVHETTPKENLYWYLITNDKVITARDAEEQIRNYIQRWKIERFHYVLKSGCKIEEKQSRSYETLRQLTLLYSVIALQILNITYVGQLCPKLSVELFLDEEEWKLLYCVARKTKQFSKENYLMEDMLYDLAVLGGRKGTPSDGTPGVVSVWKGLEKFFTLLEYKDFLV